MTKHYLEMRIKKRITLTCIALIISGALSGCANHAKPQPSSTASTKPVVVEASTQAINPGTRGPALSQGLDPGLLQDRLTQCTNGPFQRTRFSIGHRGAPLGYPEHTRQGYVQAAAMGAGLVECDVTFTRDLELVCRHSQCDLHRTTNILDTKLARQCTRPFTPASDNKSADALCCTSDITLEQFRSLCGRSDHVNSAAVSVAGYLEPYVSPIKTELSANPGNDNCPALMTHAESIQLFEQLGVDFVPELKAPQVPMPFQGLTQTEYASRMLNEYIHAGISPARVFPQSFRPDDLRFWIDQHPQFAEQAVYLDGRGRNPAFRASLADMQQLYRDGFRIIAPPIPVLLRVDEHGEIQASDYANYARSAGLKIITWALEAGSATDPNNFMYASVRSHMQNESGMLQVLNALHKKVGVIGVFSDWAGTVTYYANCFDLE